MRNALYPRLAAQNIRRDRKFYLPYLLTLMGTAAAFYIVSALGHAPNLPDQARYAYLSIFLTIGTAVIAVFAAVFLTYTGSFLSKRRQRELGLYNILGMGKGHIALVLGFETLYLALGGIGGGLLLGVALQAAATWAIGVLMRFPTRFSFFFSPSAALAMAALLGGILLFNLLLNLRRVHAQKPVELLHSDTTGEREPRTRWLLAALGVAALGGGYAIALLTRSAMEAIAVYFLAVILVVIGTYCLFVAVSIVVLKGLRKNKRFYYQTPHFIGVSGMLYRMKRNAVGLANICILCTMVLVMVSGTLTLYLGTETDLERKFPGEVTLTARYDPLDEAPLDKAALDARFAQLAAQWGYTPRHIGQAVQTTLTMAVEEGWYREYPEYLPEQRRATMRFLSYKTYEGLTGRTVSHDGTAHIFAQNSPQDVLRLDFGGGNALTYPVGAPLEVAPETLTAMVYVADDDCYVVLPEEELLTVSRAQLAGYGSPLPFSLTSFWDLGGDSGQHEHHLNAILEQDWSGVGQYARLQLQSRAAYAEEYYSMNGGFFFLGLFLGLLFLMAAVLILYYKQVSEGYEDRARYQIMANVGLSDRDIRRSINLQMLVVFFAPLAVAAVHVAFDFPLVTQLLRLFGMTDTPLFLRCTLAAFAGFSALYLVVYRLTARVYYRLVR